MDSDDKADIAFPIDSILSKGKNAQETTKPTKSKGKRIKSKNKQQVSELNEQPMTTSMFTKLTID